MMEVLWGSRGRSSNGAIVLNAATVDFCWIYVEARNGMREIEERIIGNDEVGIFAAITERST